MISKEDVIINIDESSFNRYIRREYSWLSKGRSTPIVNDRTKRRAWLTLATWNTGVWLAMALSETMDSKRFCLFLKILELIISRHCHNFEKLLTVIMDNARTHSSRLTKKVIEGLEFKIRFLTPYCPEVAPVERVFGLIKSKLRFIGGTQSINFDKQEGIELIFELIISIREDSWKQTWIGVIREGRRSIVSTMLTYREDPFSQ